jgi:type II secretory ATPase GspE/PulE/Tfp pilus assembly ATPase PilB-like protein
LIDQITRCPDAAATLLRWSKAAQGLVLVSGPDGSGKTTTAYSCIAQVATAASARIRTVEDQLTHDLDGVDQRQIETETGAETLAALSDPEVDVLFVNGTPALWAPALDAAESGRLVFVQVEADSAGEALATFQQTTQRQVDATLVGVVWQQLNIDPETGRRHALYRFLSGALDR